MTELFWGEKISIWFDFQQIVHFQYEIQHNLRSLNFMIFKWLKNSLDNRKNTKLYITEIF